MVGPDRADPSFHRLLTLHAALPPCWAALVEGDTVPAQYETDDVAALPTFVAALMSGLAGPLHAVVVTVGPGSFTGLRASIALAQGVALAAGVPALGVSVGAAVPEASWTVVDSKRGRLFLERDGIVDNVGIEALPMPAGLVTLAGDATAAVVTALRTRGADAIVAAEPLPTPLGLALAVRAGRVRPAIPLYVDPPAARPGPPGRPAPL